MPGLLLPAGYRRGGGGSGLRQAGAIIVGKTNLDQFATGLVGVRSPYGVPRNPFDAKLIPGGSSSGSAVAVAAGLVPLALGTDTAGSGRVPAALNNIVGLKPSLGMISTAGVVPACRTLDCVSVFALTVDDAMTALAAMAGPDNADPYSRSHAVGVVEPLPRGMRIGVPPAGQRIFFGDREATRAYDDALARFAKLGATIVEIDVEPFYETARLLYEGPWLAERYLAVRSMLASSPEAIHPVTRTIILEGARPTAADAFVAFYRLQELRQARDGVLRASTRWRSRPCRRSTPSTRCWPIRSNSTAGSAPTPTSSTCSTCAGSRCRRRCARTARRPASRCSRPPAATPRWRRSAARSMPIPVCRWAQPVAHSRRSRKRRAHCATARSRSRSWARTFPAWRSTVSCGCATRASSRRRRPRADYRLYALTGVTPPKPGLLRVADGEGAAITVEVWALSPAEFGRFVGDIPPPMSIGTVRLAGGGSAKGFLVEARAVDGARDISSFGGWRAFTASKG